MKVEFFQHDLERATKALDDVLTPEEATARRPRRPRRDALDVLLLTQLVGTSIRRKAALEVVKRFALSRTAQESGAGFQYSAPKSRLKVETDKIGVITAVRLKPSLGDRILENPLEIPGKPIDALRRGHVRAALGLPTVSSQQPDFDRFEYATYAVSFSYAERGGAVAAVRIAPVQGC